MGRPNKRRRAARGELQNPNPPKYSSPTLIVGQISPNVVSSVLGPRLKELAVKSVEEYADEMLAYEQQRVEAAVAAGASSVDEEGEVVDGESKEEEKEVELDIDGNIVVPSDDSSAAPSINIVTDIPPPPSSNRLFTAQADIDELSHLLSETTSHFATSPGKSSPWKVHANAAKFERLLDEKYGRFRPFIESHPQVEIFIKNVQRKYAMGQFSPFRSGKDPVNKSTAIIILFMMHRNNVRFDALVLAATFCLVGLQPWALVTLVALGKWEMERRKGKRVYGMPKKLTVCEPYYARGSDDANENLSEDEERSKKYSYLTSPVGEKYNPADLSLRDEDYDVLLLGSGVETLYAGALLARAGRKVCVLSPSEDISECVMIGEQLKGSGKFANVPFDIKSSNVAHLEKQQRLLAPALCTATDTQGGIRFAKVGSAIDGYAHSILSVPGLGMDTIASSGMVVVNAEGPKALAEYCSTCLGDGYPGVDLEGKDTGNSTSLSYLKACRQINDASGEYYLQKLYAASKPSDSNNVYQQATIRPASAFLNKCLPYNPHVRSLMSALGSANENLCPDKTSMAAHVTHLCAMTNTEGMAYPIGGPRALGHALTSVIEQCGGRVVRGVSLQELLFDKLPEKKEDAKKKTKEEGEDPTTTSGPKPRCKGVRLQNGCEITVSDTGGAVISTLGLIPTFLHLVPSDVRTLHGVPPGLPAISERRPLLKILVGLNGTSEELDITGADWYRLPNATLPRDEVDATGQPKFGKIGVDVEEEEEGGAEGSKEGETIAETTVEERPSGGRGKRSKAPATSTLSPATTTSAKKLPRVKFASGTSWMKVSFPSAKDPSWADRHGSISTCVITIEADDDLVRMFDTKPRIYSISNKAAASGNGDLDRLSQRVLKDLMENFPQLDGKIGCVQIVGPCRSGLAQNIFRFAISGNRPSTPYPGLYIGGADLTVADSFSGAIVGGWLAANAVLGYSALDHMYLKKNITSDLERFLDEPSEALERNGVIVEDLAVPLVEKCAAGNGKEGEEERDNNTNAAESSKEE